jgi:hypothetical protein
VRNTRLVALGQEVRPVQAPSDARRGQGGVWR